MSDTPLTSHPVRLRHMRQDDIETAMALKTAEGWNQTRLDWELFLENYPESCLVATHKDKVIGTVTGINYENKVAWIGMMLVDTAFRSQGIGKKLMQAVIHSLSNSSSIKLDATPAGFPVYEKLGFREEYGVCRMTSDNYASQRVEEDYKSNVAPLTTENLHEIIALDQEAFGANRMKVLVHALRQQPDLACMYKVGDHLKGFVLARKGTRYTHLGPLVAINVSVAKILVEYVCSLRRDEPLVLDAPVFDADWISWLESCGFQKQRDLYRMYLKSNSHSGKPERCFLIAGPELG